MYTILRISALIVFVVTQVQHGTRVKATPPLPVPMTEKQIDLLYGIYIKQEWPRLWFGSVKDGSSWEDVSRLINPASRPGSLKKLRLIPQIMGCMYGLKFNWFFSLAVRVIGECNQLWQQQNSNPSDCWKELAEGLQKGSDTVADVMRSFTYIYSISDNYGFDINLDAFYQAMSRAKSFLGEHTVEEYAFVMPGHTFIHLMEGPILALGNFLTSNCQPEYEPLQITELMNRFERRFPGANSYDIYVHIMKYYMEEVSTHLIEIGFHYNAVTGKTYFTYR